MSSGTKVPLNQKLPDEQLLILFSYFPVNELVCAQRVCSGWRAVAQDKCLWKNFTLTLYGGQQDEKYIRTMPALKHIDGDASNDLVDVILETTTELVRMNCKFEPPLSSSQTRRMLEKYPELESISLDVRAPDILESVNILKTSESLKEVNFTIHRSHPSYLQYQVPESLSQAYSVFLYDEYFTALTNMDISYADSYNVLVDVIKKRSSKLLSLKCTSDVVTNAISMCTELHKLQLSLSGYFYSEIPVHIKIENMNHLRSLHINAGDCVNYLPTLYDSFCQGSWLHLKEASLEVPTENMNLLKAAIINMKQLKKLRYCVNEGNLGENELENIGSLQHLEKLIIDGLNSFTEEGASYMSQCINLKYFLLHAHTSTIDNCNIANIMKPMKKLESMVLGIDNTYKFLSCRQEIEEFLTQVTAKA